MTDPSAPPEPKSRPHLTPSARSAEAARRRKLERALKDNLARRRAQRQGRDTAEPGPSDEG